MQEVEVQPRDIFQHFIRVDRKGQTLLWWFSTKNKNISFGLYKRAIPGELTNLLSISTSSPGLSSSSSVYSRDSGDGESPEPPIPSTPGSLGRKKMSSASYKLAQAELIEVIPIQHYDSFSNTIKGQYTVKEEGTYVLCFDNTYSRNTPKKLTFFVSLSNGELGQVGSQPEVSGWILKKKRKKMQGWAKRWLELDQGNLSYRLHPQGVIRGSIQLAMCTVAVSPHQNTIHVDSGTIIYHLRALTKEDYDMWVKAIRSSKRSSMDKSIMNLENGVRLSGESRTSSSFSGESEESPSAAPELNGMIARMERDFSKVAELIAKVSQRDPAAKQLSEEFRIFTASKERMVERVRKEMLQWASESGKKQVVTPSVPGGRSRPVSMLSTMSHDVFYDADEDILNLDEKEQDGQAEAEDSDQMVPTVEEEEETRADLEEQLKRNAELRAEVDAEVTTLAAPTNFTRRQLLPHPVCGDEVSLLSILRKNVGKELSAVSMPVSVNEPLNVLQRLCEDLEYCELLDKANQLEDSMMRLAYVAAFSVSSFSNTQHRIARKPFNPLLGETYECVFPEKGFRFISEKVSHHPPIMACHAESPNFTFYQDNKVKTKFWGKSLELIPSGVVHVRLPRHGDHFTYTKPSTWTRNMLGGTRYFEHIGEVRVTNRTTGEYADLTYRESDFWGNKRNEVEAVLRRRDGTPWRTLRGKWNEGLALEVGADDLHVLWRAKPAFPGQESYYGFSRFAIQLNEITPDLRGKLPPTDTRYRPDQRLFEEGKVAEADAEKERVERLQRENRRRLEAEGRTWVPQWFELREDDYGEEGKSWQYRGRYWETREQGTFEEKMRLW
ncbi:uncharacterized protein VTP21DRAFT_9390 [Calcarisporiella thermophila]|uniref:uncharacterized protein n=1 Tax=Calcarisporiella thermophila TaxID=911321 RepID=UPI003742EF3E